jgi:hypothetical protein
MSACPRARTRCTVVVREVDDAAHRDREDVRDEPLVALIQAYSSLVRLAECAARRAFEIDDADLALSGILVPVIASADLRDGRPPLGARLSGRRLDASADGGRGCVWIIPGDQANRERAEPHCPHERRTRLRVSCPRLVGHPLSSF